MKKIHFLRRVLLAIIFQQLSISICAYENASDDLRMEPHIQSIISKDLPKLLNNSEDSHSLFIGPSEINSGKNETLLTFAAKNNITSLAKYAISRGSLINHANSEKETMLSISVKNKNIYFIELALQNKANPNLLTGSGTSFITDLITNELSIEAWLLIEKYNIKPNGVEEKQKAMAYLENQIHTQTSETEIQKYQEVLNYVVGTEPNIRSSVKAKVGHWPEIMGNPYLGASRYLRAHGYTLYVSRKKPNIIRKIDGIIARGIDTGMTEKASWENRGITEKMMKEFNVNGMNFFEFLLSNHMWVSLAKYITLLPNGMARELVVERKYDKNNLLEYAILNNYEGLVKAIIPFSDEIINKPLPKETSRKELIGHSPLQLAIRSSALEGIFQMLITAGASVTYRNKQGQSAWDMMHYEDGSIRNYHVYNGDLEGRTYHGENLSGEHPYLKGARIVEMMRKHRKRRYWFL